MNEKGNLTITLDQELLEKFKLALTLKSASANAAIESMIKKYAIESFSEAARSVDSRPDNYHEEDLIEHEENDNHLDPRSPKYGKANKKIPIWAYRNHQNNHKIIKAFLQIEKEKKYVDLSELKRRCTNKNHYPETFCTGFDGNFAAMKSDSSNSHGKVFVVKNSRVEIWPVIADTLETYKRYFEWYYILRRKYE